MMPETSDGEQGVRKTRMRHVAGALALLGALALGCQEQPEEEPEWGPVDPTGAAFLELSEMSPEEKREFCRIYREEGPAGVRRLPRSIEEDWVDEMVEEMIRFAEKGC
jgi:hypothetical protein